MEGERGKEGERGGGRRERGEEGREREREREKEREREEEGERERERGGGGGVNKTDLHTSKTRMTTNVLKQDPNT